jgi:homocitrate synthase
MTDAQYKECTIKLKQISDIRPLGLDDGDSIIRAFHQNLKTGENKPLLDSLSAEEDARLQSKESDLNPVPEKRQLDQVVEDQAQTERLIKKAKVTA